jgi:hypothetical protein
LITVITNGEVHMTVILQADLNLNDPNIIDYFKQKTDLTWLKSYPNTRIANSNAEWTSDPKSAFQLDSSMVLKKTRKAGAFLEVPGDPADSDEEGTGTVKDQKLVLNTCARATYKIYKDTASYTVRTVDIPIQHELECTLFSDLFISDTASTAQEQEIIRQFDLADAKDPNVGSIISTLEGQSISAELYNVVPKIVLRRMKLRAVTTGLDRFLSLRTRNQAEEYWQDSWVIGEDGRQTRQIGEWADETQLRIVFSSVQHLSSIPALPELPEHTYKAPITEEERREAAINELSEDDLSCSNLTVKEDKKLATIIGYPEFRIKWRTKRIKVGCVKITISYPQLQTRWTTEELYLMIVAEVNVERLIISVGKECAIRAFLVGGITAYLSGNFPLAVKTFKAAFYVCVVDKLTDFPKCFIPELKIVKEPGKWRPL